MREGFKKSEETGENKGEREGENEKRLLSKREKEKEEK